MHPAVDATPIRPDVLGDFIGIEIKEPQVTPTETIAMYLYGKQYEFAGEAMYLHCVERGSRPSALDTYLYDIARADGVKFEFGHEVKTDGAAWLPPDSIIATGLFFEPFSDLSIPYVQLYGYVARGRHEGPTRVTGWFDTYTRDYCYYACTNGVTFGLCFDRRPTAPS